MCERGLCNSGLPDASQSEIVSLLRNTGLTVATKHTCVVSFKSEREEAGIALKQKKKIMKVRLIVYPESS